MGVRYWNETSFFRFYRLKAFSDMTDHPQRQRSAHLDLGDQGEKLAAIHLQKHGYEILARNWRNGPLEIDLICRLNQQIIFVEVKTRRSKKYGGPLGAMTQAKKAKLIKAAQSWLEKNEMWSSPCRFDVIALVSNQKSFSMEHIVNAFEAGDFVDSCHTSWQF